jgi:hypothetical protein
MEDEEFKEFMKKKYEEKSKEKEMEMLEKVEKGHLLWIDLDTFI